MRKLISLLVAVIMVMSLATVGFAEETTTAPVAEAHETDVVLNKLYTTSGEKTAEGVVVTDATIFPKETLKFTATWKSGPEQVDGMTVADLVTNGAETGTMKISLPDYDTVGVYTYEIAETAGNTQAVTYSTNKILVSVLVEWNEDHTDLISTVYLTQPKVDGMTSTGNVKNDTFTNTYELGHLDVKKTVSGNLASQDATFNVTVTFNSANPVGSDITCVDSETTSTVALTGDADNGYTATKVITLKHNETVHFYNIPVGVTYTVVEDAKHKLTEGTVDPNSAADEDYTATGEVTTAKAVAEGTVTEIINNDKATNVATGVITDSAPYIILIAVCAVAAVLFVTKRRSVEF